MAQSRPTYDYTLPVGSIAFVKEPRKPNELDISHPIPTLWFDETDSDLYILVANHNGLADWKQMPIGYERKFVYLPINIKGWWSKLIDFIFRG